LIGVRQRVHAVHRGDHVNIAGTDIDPAGRQRGAADHGDRNPRRPGAAQQVFERPGPAGRCPGDPLPDYLVQILPEIGDRQVEVPGARRVTPDQICPEPEFRQGLPLTRVGIQDPENAPAALRAGHDPHAASSLGERLPSASS
jgi:hypothetical protein